MALVSRAAPIFYLVLAGCGDLVGCAEREAAPLFASGPVQPSPSEKAPHNAAFVERTHSPQPAADGNAEVRELANLCGASDAALSRVAAEIAGPGRGGEKALDVDRISYALREAGAPYVWPRAWSFEGGAGELGEARTRMQRWLATFGDGGERRCGVEITHPRPGRLAVSAVAIDALADLAPLPTRARVGQWLDVRATLLVPATGAKLVVLGPHGAPHAVVTSLVGSELRARFNADQPGAWLVQVLAVVAGGPRPLLEALVFAGVEPEATFSVPSAPGEEAATLASDPTAALYAMINRARASERGSALERDATLEQVARAHAEAMRKAHKTAHDAGDGDLGERLANAGLALYAGENVAHAASAALAHRALWASPSHRENLLFPDFVSVGVGVATDSDGTLWVCEVFGASALRSAPE